MYIRPVREDGVDDDQDGTVTVLPMTIKITSIGCLGQSINPLTSVTSQTEKAWSAAGWDLCC